MARQPENSARIQTGGLIFAALVEGVALFVAVIGCSCSGRSRFKSSRELGSESSSLLLTLDSRNSHDFLSPSRGARRPAVRWWSNGGLVFWTVVVFGLLLWC